MQAKRIEPVIRSLIFVIALLTATTFSNGQDGSDIRYVDIQYLDGSHIGKMVHLDFYNDSFRTGIRDTVMIPFGHASLKFIERRKDDGYNNWFSQQYLESIKTFDGMKIRLVRSAIREIREDSIFVEHYFDYYNREGDLLHKKRVVQPSWIRRKSLNKVLIKSTPY